MSTGIRVFLYAVVGACIQLLMLQTGSADAQTDNETFRHFSTADGLSHAFIWTIHQDRHGFMWFTNQEGVNRYDGTRIISYRSDATDPDAISTGRVPAMLEDEASDLMLFPTAGGLNLFDPATNRFSRAKFREGTNTPQVTHSLFRDANGDIWMGGSGGLVQIPEQDLRADTLTATSWPLTGRSSNYIMSIARGGDDFLWIGTGAGLIRFYPETGLFSELEPLEGELAFITTTAIWVLLNDRNGKLWISAVGGLAHWHPGADAPVAVHSLGEGSPDLRNQPMQGLFEDDQGRIWIGTGFEGALMVDPESGFVRNYRHDAGNVNSIRENDVHFVRPDENGNVWFGYHNYGFSVKLSGTWNYAYEPVSGEYDWNDEINFFEFYYREDGGNVWIGTGDGLVMRPAGGGPQRVYYPDPDNSIDNVRSNNVWAMIPHEGNYLTPTGANRLYLFDPGRGTFRNIPLSKENVFIMDVNEGEYHYFVSYSSGGIDLIRKSDLSVRYVPNLYNDPDDQTETILYVSRSSSGELLASHIKQDGPDMTWTAYRLDPETLAVTDTLFTSPERSSYTRLALLSKTRPGVVWAVSNEGMYRFDIFAGEERLLYNNHAGLLSSLNLPFYEHDDGNLWMHVSHGIVKLEPDTERIYFYELQPGRSPIMMGWGWNTDPSTGEIITGGQGGMIRFNPDETVAESSIRHMHITELRSGPDIFNPLYSPQERYTLAHDRNNLVVSFLALNYRNPAGTRYRYRLGGYDDTWNEIGNQQQLYLANLAPGRYILEVQAAPGPGEYTSPVATLPLTILPPWYRTTPAYLFFSVLLIGFIVGIDRVQRRRVISRERDKAREKELEQAREIEKAYQNLEKAHKNLESAHQNLKSAQDQLIQQEKLASLGQLTAGIAHEIKNPLNFVNNFSEVSLEMIDEVVDDIDKLGTGETAEAGEQAAVIRQTLADIKSNLKKIHEHGSRADGIVKSMLLHSRGGSGEMKPTDLNALVQEYVNLAYHGMRAGKDPINVDIDLQPGKNVGEVPLISEDFSRVILNLCHNAFDAMREKMSTAGSSPAGSSSAGSFESLPQSGSPRSVPANQTGSPRTAPATQTSVPSTHPHEYTPRLTIRTAKTNGSITIEIEDNGPGIPEDIRDKILQPFFTTKKGTQGTGLGLSITHDIIKAHGGTLGIESVPGTSTIFKIILTDAV